MSFLDRKFGLAERWVLILALLFLTTLACITNTPAAYVSTPRPTRTPLSTFTITPIPPTLTSTPTSTNTPLATDTPIPTPTPLFTDTPTPTPTHTPIPPTSTSVPSTNTPIPPTPTPTLTPVAVSVLPTPTNTPEPNTPPGRYEEDDTDFDQNCAHIGVIGRVYHQDGEAPIQYVTIQVTGDENPYKGPYTAKTNEDGYYTIVIGELKDDIDGVEFKAIITGGPGVESLDDPEWEVSDDCEDDNAIQIMEIDWQRKND